MSRFKAKYAIAISAIIFVAVGATVLTLTFLSQDSHGTPEPFLGALYAKQTTCTLSNGTCSMIIVNNSTASIDLSFCNINVFTSSPNSSSRTIAFPNGTLSGQVLIGGVPARSAVTARCTIPTSSLAYESNGSIAAGTFSGTSKGQWYSDPAGSYVSFNFIGAWSR